jgi:transposase
MMRFFTQPHRFYCGIDLHTKAMHVCVQDRDGNVLVDRNLATDAKAFLEAIAPYRDGIVVSVECTFSWYWLADLCQAQNIPFVLGHALYMRLIHGAKGKNDRIDADKITRLLRSGSFPLAYAYPKGMRETRDLLRRRMYLVRQRSALLTHVQIVNSQYNLSPLAKTLLDESKHADIVARFADASVRQNVAVDLRLIDHVGGLIGELEEHLARTVKVEDPQAYYRLQTIPGVGKILGLVLLYETHDWSRFDSVGQFLSYARLVRCAHESAGKRVGSGNRKIGNAHLKWAIAEAACLFLRFSERAKQWKQRYTQKHGQRKAMSVLAAKLGRTVYHLLRKKEVFDEERFWNGGGRAKKQASAAAESGAGCS